MNASPREQRARAGEIETRFALVGNQVGHYNRIGDHWSAGQSLAQMIVHIGEMICYQRYILKSPLNAKAAAWAEQHLAALPLQKIDLSTGL